MRKMHIATGASRQTKIWKNVMVTWEELAERLATTTKTAETQGEYGNMPKGEQDRIKDVGGFVGGKLRSGRRKAGDVEYRDLLTLDADFAAPDLLDKLDVSLSCAWCVYSTHKHKAEKPRLRLVIPLDRPVTAEEYEAIARKVAEGLGMDQFDDTTYQPHRLMYWPSTSLDGEFVFEQEGGPALSADAVLAEYRDWKDVSEWPFSSRAKQDTQRLLKKQEDPTEKKGLVGAFCRAYSVEEAMDAFLPGVYTPCSMPGRYTYAAGSTSAGAVVYDGGKFLYSNHATDPAGGQLCNAFDLVRIHKFGARDEDAGPKTPTVKKPSYLAMQELAAEDAKVKRLLHQERREAAANDFQGLMEGQEGEDGDDWITGLDVNSKGHNLPSIHNVHLILGHDPALAGKIRKNDFTKKCRVFGRMPWEKKAESAERDWTDADDAGLRLYLEQLYQIKGKSVIEDGWTLAAEEKKYHPVRDYLNGLTWDGKARAERVFIDYLGAEDCRYVREVTKRALTAAVARVFVPGIKYDTVLVLVGPQGDGKSQILKRLGREWFSDSLTTVQGREAYEQIQGFWIIEMGELAAMRRQELESIKLFTAKSEDSFRAAYGRHVETHKRQCVFFGTTNTHDFLKDMTGNRRFWPVDVNQKQAEKDLWKELTEEEVGQIWAEATAFFRRGDPIYLEEKALQALAEEAQDRHLEESPLAGDIQEYLEMLLPENWEKMDLFARRSYVQHAGFPMEPAGVRQREKVCALEIWCELLNGDKRDLTKSFTREINDIILKLGGWERMKSGVRFGELYGKQRGFIRTCVNS